MTMDFLSAKIHVPPLPRNLVPRSGLTQRLRESESFPIVLVSAPAGFGKSSLAAEYVSLLRDSRSGPVKHYPAWLSLDSDDDDPVRFWASMAASLERASAEAFPEHSPFQELAESVRSTQPMSVNELSAALALAVERAACEFLLIADDFHLITSKPVMESFRRFLDRLPANLRVLILSRREPSLPLARLRARGILREFRADDLRFSREETGLFLEKNLGNALSGEQVDAINSKTEGWAAGLQMAALSLSRRPDAEGFIRNFSGSDRFVLEFLIEEVLAAHSSEIGNFLLDSALLDRFCAELLDEAIRPEGGAEEMLRQMERLNLFLVPLDDEGLWFRYHHLFSQALRSRRRSLRRAGEKEILLAAADWHEKRDAPSEAVNILMRIGEKQRAADILDRIAYSVLSQGERYLLETRIVELGRDIVLAHPELAQIAAWTRVFSGRETETDTFLIELEKSAREAPEEKTRRDLTGAVAVMRAFTALQRGNVPLAEKRRQKRNLLSEWIVPLPETSFPSFGAAACACAAGTQRR